MKSWWRCVLAYPATWIAAALLAALVWTTITWLEPPGIVRVTLVILALVAVVAWPWTLSATGTLARLQFVVPRVEEVDPHEIAALAAELDSLADPHPRQQLEALRHKRESLAKVLERRLDAGELTYARYLATAQQVYRSALDNLHEVVLAHHSISSIDDGYIDRRLGELANDDSDQESSQRERASLEQRRELRTSQRTKIARLSAQNEAAITALNRTATALADAPIGTRPDTAESAMAALERLADRANEYAD